MFTNLTKEFQTTCCNLRDPAASSSRLAAVETLQNLCNGHARSSVYPVLVMEAVENPHAEVRVAVFELLGHLFKTPVIRVVKCRIVSPDPDCALKLVEGLDDPVAEVRAAAFHCLGTLRPKVLQACDLEPKLMTGLEDSAGEVRAGAFHCLGKFPSHLLEVSALKPKLVKGLKDPLAEVRVAALHCLGNFPSRFFQACDLRLELANGLQDPLEKVRSAACKTLEVHMLDDLDHHVQEQMQRLEDSNADVRQQACVTLSSLSPNSLARYSCDIVKILDAEWDFWSSHAPDDKLHVSIRLLFKVPIEESQERNTWLHIAAQCGSTKVCQALLASGLATKPLRNAKHQTASDVACVHGHAALAESLSPSTFQTRGGSGGAIAKALDSGEGINEVSWWFIPLPGWEGTLGAVHSMLKIDTGKDQYLIEGACPEKVKPEGVQRPEIEKADENGLFISNWTEIKDAANVQKLTDVKSCRPFGILLAALVHHLLQLGPYHVGSNNCHHTALHGYNFCAAEPLRRLPINGSLTAFARFFSRLSIDLAVSRSCAGPLPFLPIYAGIPRDENVTLALPRHWTGQVRNGVVDLDKSSDEFLKVEAYLKENSGDKIPGFQIIDIKRNQNLVMLKAFRNELHNMHEQRQLRLFHSAGDAHDTVMKEGFKMAYSNLTFNAYGAGIYFAQDLRLPDHFSPKSDAGVKQVFLCCVAAGKSHVKKRIFEFLPGDRLSGRSEDEWREELRKPEHRQAPDGYDSCIAESREALIVHRESQVLWEYAVRYKSTGSAGNPYGALRGLLQEVPPN